MVPGIGRVTAVRCFTVAQILQIVAMTGHAIMTSIILSGDNDMACDGRTHHII